MKLYTSTHSNTKARWHCVTSFSYVRRVQKIGPTMVHRLQRCLQIENHTFSEFAVPICPDLGSLGSFSRVPWIHSIYIGTVSSQHLLSAYRTDLQAICVEQIDFCSDQPGRNQIGISILGELQTRKKPTVAQKVLAF